MRSGRGFAGFGWGKLLCFFFPNFWIELALSMSFFEVLLTGIVPSGHLPFWCHSWVIGFEFEETLLSPKGCPSGWKFGFICIKNPWLLEIQVWAKERERKKELTRERILNCKMKRQWIRKVKFFTWILRFLRSGWSKAGWWETWTQSIISPSGLCFHNNRNAN